jgi:hypothetical protein
METLVIRAFYHLQEVARSCSLDLTWLEGRGGNELGFAAEALLSVEPGSSPHDDTPGASFQPPTISEESKKYRNDSMATSGHSL